MSEVLEKVLPSDCEDALVRDEFAVLIARMMCDNMQYFKENYSDVVQRHIPHKYEQEMSTKSEVVRIIQCLHTPLKSYKPCFILLKVPLGVILKNENLKSEMIEIMDELQGYAPISTDSCGETVHQLLFGGDQLTAARARGCAELRINSDTPTGRLTTLLPVAEDWHTLVTLLTVS